ncbi:MAG: DUF5009 domain-containing protein [Candidatus Saccharimonadaceae bacterium]
MDLSTKRIQTIDILRALTVALMIFVNDIPSVVGIPDWLRHAPVSYDAMYLADIVFPLFLFWVGMSIPLAIDGRQKKGDSVSDILLHIMKRSAGLLFIGVLMVNIGNLSSQQSGIDQNIWAFLMYVGVITYWRIYGKEKTERGRWIGKVSHYIGVILLIYVIVIFRTEEGGWLTPQWWGILGLIGWAYLATAVTYIFFKNKFNYLILIFIALLVYHGVYSGFPWLRENTGWLSLNAYGGHAALSFAGMMATIVMLRYRSSTITFFKVWGVSGLLFFVMAFLFRSFWGIQKNAASPSWVWLSVAIGLWLLILVWYIIEKKDYTSWALLFKPAGTNTFLAYLLPNLYYHFIWFFGLSYPAWLNHSLGGIIRSIVFTILIVQLTGLIAKHGVRLKL